MNPAAEALSGISSTAAAGKPFELAIHSARSRNLLPMLRACIETGDHASSQEQLQLENGETIFDTACYPVKDDAGTVRLLILSSRNITEPLRVAGLLHRLSAAVEQSPVPMVITDTEGIIEYVNPAFCANSQYTPAEALGKSPRIVRGDATSRDEYGRLWKAIKSGQIWRGTFHNRRKDGSLHWEEAIIAPLRDAQGNITKFAGFQQDITARKTAEERVAYLAHHDPLTGLPNHTAGQEAMEAAITQAANQRTRVAAIFLDLDGFKQVNDALGHDGGDALLKAVAERLAVCVGKTATLARHNGDEFLIVLPNVRDRGAIPALLSTIMERMAQPFDVNGHARNISLSAGVAVCPEDGTDYATLLKKADLAMYAVKDAGKNSFRFYTKGMHSNAAEYLELRAKLQKALDQNEFELHYQPQVDLKSGKVTGVEALLRWNSPELGLVSPDRFIPIAEDSGLIVPIGDWVLSEACRQAAAWQKAGMGKIVMAVNLSPVQLRSGEVVESVRRALYAAKLPASCLELEVDETVLIKDTAQVLSTVHGLKALGVMLTVDGFGTGYSSLTYLKRYGASKVKIDQSFIRDLTNDTNSEMVVASIVQMARSLGLTTIAAGVEDIDVLHAVRERDCDGVQGYFYSRPMPAAEARNYLAAHHQPGV
jgi:diguanylate cyclase (GGDEF)-like protein/PAS domain S-box-containing protein